MKNPDDPRFWVIDPDAADVVRHIYRLALEGNGPMQIATALCEAGILNPTTYRTSKGISKGGSKSTLEPTKWNHTTVKKILSLQEYCGDVINFKTYSKSYKMKRRIENPEENRAIFLDVHEPIIDRISWEKVQSLHTTRRRRTRFTHNEAPWLTIRRDLLNSAPSDRIIERSVIGACFDAVKAKYNMVNLRDIKDYAQDMFRQL